MHLLSLTLALMLPMDGLRFTGDFQLDINPVFAVDARLSQWGAAGTTLPGLVLLDQEGLARLESWGETRTEVIRHELMHTEQQAALGPGFWVAYALTAGRPFEPYDPLEWFVGIAAAPTEYKPNEYGQMWMPEPEERQRYPLLRLARRGGTGSIELLPGYPRLLTIR